MIIFDVSFPASNHSHFIPIVKAKRIDFYLSGEVSGEAKKEEEADTNLSKGGATASESEAAKMAANRVEYINKRSEASEEENKAEPIVEVMSTKDDQVPRRIR